MPSRTVEYLTVEEVLLLHEKVIERFGGDPGVRDLGLLESDLFRPQTGYYRDLAEQAAALFESLLMNHPFVDGNKRVAFSCTDVFLRLNGWKLIVEPIEGARSLLELLEKQEADFKRLLEWIRKAMKPEGSATIAGKEKS